MYAIRSYYAVSNLYVYALFPSKTAEAMTSKDGKFTLNPLESYPAGQYTVDVYAVITSYSIHYTKLYEKKQLFLILKWLVVGTIGQKSMILTISCLPVKSGT